MPTQKAKSSPCSWLPCPSLFESGRSTNFYERKTRSSRRHPMYGSMPTVAIHILPDSVPSSIFANIQRSMAAVRVPLSTLVDAGRSAGKPVRQDRYTIQLVSLGTSRRHCGAQWQIVDDADSGRMDISDHTHINIDQLRAQGPGRFFGPKVMLGSSDPDIDRQAKRGTAEIYGRGPSLPTKKEMDHCDCTKSIRLTAD